jgi:hypothetical protein
VYGNLEVPAVLAVLAVGVVVAGEAVVAAGVAVVVLAAEAEGEGELGALELGALELGEVLAAGAVGVLVVVPLFDPKGSTYC